MSTALFIGTRARLANAARGDFVATVTFSQSCGSGIGVGVAYDGANLWYSCYNSSPDLYRADPATGQVTASYTIAGGLGALAYDATRNAIWAGWGGSNTGNVYLIQLDQSRNVLPPTAVAFYAGDAIVCGLDDGLAYDAQNDTLYFSDDCSTTIHHYDTNGNHLTDGPNNTGDFTWAGNACYNSGLAIGGSLLYEGSNGCNHVWVVDKTNPVTPVFDFSTFVASDPNFRDEDLECDTNTFAAQGKHVMWSKEAYEPMRVHAFEIAFGSCGIGGKPPPPGKRPIVLVPGIQGTELIRVDNGSRVWLSLSSLLNPLDPFNDFLFPLLLQPDGATPDMSMRCAANPQRSCTGGFFDCGLFDSCVPGGTTMEPENVVNIRLVYTAYNDLLSFLQDPSNGGYTLGTDLFVCPYDWRLNLHDEAVRLDTCLTNAGIGPTDQVDVIAHSMGGLLVRAFLERYPADQRIAQIIYLGTPQRGAPKAYGRLIGSTTLVSLSERLFFDLNTQTFLAQNFPAVYDLLPRFDFVLINSGAAITFEELQTSFNQMGPRCSTPSLCGTANGGLISEANALYNTQLAGPERVRRSFAINGTGKRTLARFDYTRPSCPRGLTDPTGDGTVPSVSSGLFLDGSASVYVAEEHSALPGNTHVQQQILNILNGQETTLAEGIRSTTLVASDGWNWSSCSPIHTHIMDTAGNLNGLDANGNLHEEIEDSNQFRFSENEGGFVPFGKSYEVTIDATDNGVFTLEFDHVTGPNDSPIGSTVYAGIPISSKSHGQISLSPTSPTPNLLLDVDGDGTVDFSVPANQPPPPSTFPAVLINIVHNFNLPHPSINQALVGTLRAAATALARGDKHAAKGQLGAFLNQVSALRGKVLTTVQADTLNALVRAALTGL